MRKIIYLILFASVLSVQAQVPGQIAYQALVRNAIGQPLPNQSVGIRFSIYEDGISNPFVWQEVHTIASNSLGMVNVNLGSVNSLLGLDWGSGTKFLKVEMDITGGVNYTDIGTQELMSVPYAMYSNRSQSTETLPQGEEQGNTLYYDGQAWVLNSSNLYNSGNNIGIGTTIPEEKLQVNGNIGLTGALRAVGENQNITLEPAIGASVNVNQSRIINVDTAIMASDAVSAQLVQYSYLHYANASGDYNNIIVNLPVAIDSYSPGLYIVVKMAGANTGAAQLNVNNVGYIPIKKNGSEELQAGDLGGNLLVQLIFDGTAFQVMSPLNGSNVNQFNSDSLLFTTDGF